MGQQQVYRRGDAGPAVVDIRERLVRLGLLDAPREGDFDDAVDRSVRDFQQANGLIVDGLVGPQTFRRLDDAGWRLGDRILSFTVNHPMSGEDVAELQRRLLDLGFDAGRVDWVFGEQTAQAVREFQRNSSIAVDGQCGPATFTALNRVQRAVTGGSPESLREHEAIRRAGPRLSGRVIVIDPGHGGGDRGLVCSEDRGLDEAFVTGDIAARVEGRLTALGVTAFLTRGQGMSDEDVLEDEARADFANRTGADLLVSLHCDGDVNQLANGIATYYYGRDRHGAHSAVGRRLAALVQEEVAARTDLLDCRTHAKTWELLLHSRMPAVRVEVGYLTHPSDAQRLADPQFRDVLADALVSAMQRLYLEDESAATGNTLVVPGLTSLVG
jgi:N-acetylmuramoyl-L-alanine amidase